MQEYDIIKEKLEPLRCTKFLQFGYLNAQVTRTMAKKAEVDYFSMMQFDPFEDDEKINTLSLDAPFSVVGRRYEKKKVDAIYFGNTNDFLSTRILLGALALAVRSGGYMFLVSPKDSTEVNDALEEFLGNFEESFEREDVEITTGDTLVIIKVL